MKMLLMLSRCLIEVGIAFFRNRRVSNKTFDFLDGDGLITAEELR